MQQLQLLALMQLQSRSVDMICRCNGFNTSLLASIAHHQCHSRPYTSIDDLMLLLLLLAAADAVFTSAIGRFRLTKMANIMINSKKTQQKIGHVSKIEQM